MIVILGNPAVGLVVDFICRHNIQNREMLNAFRVIQSHPVCYAAATIVAANVESFESKMFHYRNLSAAIALLK